MIKPITEILKKGRRRIWRSVRVMTILWGVALAMISITRLNADEGGASFWLPGQFASFAALPSDPGFTLGAVYYHTSVGASGSKQFQVGGLLVAGLHAQADAVFFLPTYTFAEPVLGGQASLSLAAAAMRMHASVNAEFTGRRGRTFGLQAEDTTYGGSDLYPLGSLKWHDGNNNYMAYTMGEIPSGAYEKGRLANIGLNHYTIDGGGGYTYLDPKKGHEFSAVAGVTYNFENNSTQYLNGVDSHLDWAASQFLSEKIHVGVVGYVYHQLSGDSGSGAKLGSNESRVVGLGPEGGYFFGFDRHKGYVQVKTYWEWNGSHRATGWNSWLTFVLPFG